MNLKKWCLIGGGLAGLTYGTLAVVTHYASVPFDLQLFIMAGVALAGASAGYIIGFLLRVARPDKDRTRPQLI
jgi:hypothetical protein